MSKSKSKYILFTVGIVVASVSIGLFAMQKDTLAPTIELDTPIVQKPQPLKEVSSTVPQPTVTNGYVIGVVSVSKSINGEVIKLKVYNDGSTDLKLDPKSQFKLVGLKDGTERLPLPEKITSGFEGTIISKAELNGSITFDVIAEQTSELRFYPLNTSQTYIVVPLITLPSEQQ